MLTASMQKIGKNKLPYVVQWLAIAFLTLPSLSLAANQPPTVLGIGKTTKEDKAIKISLQGKDPERKKISFSIVQPPQNGVVTIKGKTATYKPNQNYIGADSFIYTAYDGELTSLPATVDLIIQQVNDKPIAASKKLTAVKDTATQIVLSGVDLDGDSLTYLIASKPKNGLIELAGNLATYTPKPGFTGKDQFTFKVKDGKLTSKPAKMTLSVVDTVEAGFEKLTLVSVSSISGDSLTAEWLPITGANIAPAKILYTLHVSDQANFTPTAKTATLTQAGVNQATVNNLVAGRQYYVKVAAEGEQSQESWSNEIAIVTPELLAARNNVTALVPQASQSPQVTDHSVSYQDNNTPEVGSYLAGTENGGYLRKVTAVSRQGGTVIADTEPAALNEMFDTLDVHLVTQLSALPASAQAAKATAMRSASKAASLASPSRSVNWPQTGLTLVDSNSGTQTTPFSSSAKLLPKVSASNVSVNGDLQTNNGEYLQFSGPVYWSLNPDELAIFTLKAKLIGNPSEAKQICAIRMIEFSHKDSAKQQLIKNDLASNRALQIGSMVTQDAEQTASLNVAWQPSVDYVHDGGLPYYAEFEAVMDDKADNCANQWWNSQETLRLKIPIYVSMGEFPSQENKTVSFQGDFSVENTLTFAIKPEFDITARIENAHLKNATMAANFDINLLQQLKIHADGTAALDQTKEIIAPRKFTKVFMAGSVPIVVSGQFSMNMRVQGDVQGAVDLTEALGYGFPDAKIGLHYENGVWQTIQEFKPEYTFKLEGEGNAGAKLTITLIPDLQIHFYDAASGRMLLEPYLYTQAGIHGQFKYLDTNGVWLLDPPDYWFTDLQAGAGMNLRLYAGLHIFDYNIASYPENVTVNEPDKFKQISVIDQTPVLGIPSLNAATNPQVAPSGIDSRAIQIKGSYENVSNPFKTLFGIGPDAWVKFDRWTEPRLVTIAGGASVVPDKSLEAGVFWLRYTEPGTYLVRLAGHSDLGKYIRQTVETTVELTDNDNDGLVDQWESRYGLDANSPNNSSSDYDGDGLNDLAEYQAGTNPSKADSDGDGYGDLQERDADSDPLNPASTPLGVIHCPPPKLVCDVPVITNISPLTAAVGDNVNITVTGSNLPLTLVLAIDGQSNGCATVSRQSTAAVFNCPLDVVGVRSLIVQSNTTLNGGVPIASSFTSFSVSQSGNTATAKLNDTGITTCSDAASNGLTCPVAGFPGQDGQFGRDVTHNDNGDGHAGFSFTKLDSNGNPLPTDASQWDCVKDNVTGLIWEVKTTSGLHSINNTYSWYQPDNSKNGGNAGQQNGGACIGSSCDTYGYVQAVNTQGLCGAGDWRIATLNELLSIVDNSKAYPSLKVDSNYFPNISVTVWSSTQYAHDPSYAESMEFNLGKPWIYGKNYSYPVYLVRKIQ